MRRAKLSVLLTAAVAVTACGGESGGGDVTQDPPPVSTSSATSSGAQPTTTLPQTQESTSATADSSAAGPPSGLIVADCSSDGLGDLYTFDVDTHDFEQFASFEGVGDRLYGACFHAGSQQRLSFDDDFSHMAFTRTVDGQRHIFVSDREGNITDLSTVREFETFTEKLDEHSAHFIPGSAFTTLAFFSNSEGLEGWAAIDDENGEARGLGLTDGNVLLSETWPEPNIDAVLVSPDGRFAFDQAGGGDVLRTIEGTAPLSLGRCVPRIWVTARSFACEEFHFSSDELLASTPAAKLVEITDEGEAVEVTTLFPHVEGRDYREFMGSPDGSEIMFLLSEEDETALYRVGADGSEDPQLVFEPWDWERYEILDWLP